MQSGGLTGAEPDILGNSVYLGVVKESGVVNGMNYKKGDVIPWDHKLSKKSVFSKDVFSNDKVVNNPKCLKWNKRTASALPWNYTEAYGEKEP